MGGAASASATFVHWPTLLATFLLPLLASPLLSMATVMLVYPALRRVRLALGVGTETCLCVGMKTIETLPQGAELVAIQRAEQVSVSLGTVVTCREQYAGRLVGADARQTLDACHYLSAGLVSFARGLNDTPKIAALLLAAPAIGGATALLLCGAVMAWGGLSSGRRVAESMSHRITAKNVGQAFTANLVTGLVVVSASRWGLPDSTTHVSCGALFGIGAINRRGRWSFVVQVLAAWLTTLPLAAVLGFVAFVIMREVI